jgi:beta-mannosidase
MHTLRVVFCAIAVSASAHAETSLVQPYYISPRPGSQHVSLDGEWQLAFRDTPIETPGELGQKHLKWIRAQIPDSVQWSLYSAGELPHPYYHLNSKQYTWVADKVWYYRKEFDTTGAAPGQFVFLCFDGAGYYSKVWLNQEPLGRHEGMFGGPSIEISKYLRHGGPNELIVEVRAPSYGVRNWTKQSLQNVVVPWGIGGGEPYVTGNSGITTKEFLPFGLWRDVRLEIVPSIHMERPFLVTKEAGAGAASLVLTTEILINSNSLDFQLHPSKSTMLGDFRDPSISTFSALPLELHVQMLEKGRTRPVVERRFPLRLYEGRNWLQRRIAVPSPKLWWPNGMGRPDLYRVKLALLNNGKQVDSLEFDFGIRTIERLPTSGARTQDRWDNWKFVVNGRPLFIKGANWAWPMDVLLHLPQDRYRWQLEAARAAGVQMLRVWGGGNPETEDFYSRCDELGIMVLEDFPIANTETPGWKQDVWEAQALHIIFRLRNHPSLAVWSGGNEFNPYSTGNTATIGTLERSLAEFDSTRFFVRASPDRGDFHTYPDMDPTWYGHDYQWVPFLSETGIFDMCEPEAIREVVNPQELDGLLRGIFGAEFAAAHPEFHHHFLQYSLVGPQKAMWGRASQVDDLSAPTLDGLIDAARAGVGEFFQIQSDLVQANYPATTGFMPWSFTVPWPIVFPAFVDALDQATAMYYFLKRTYEPTHVLVRLPHLVWAKGETLPVSASVVHAPQNDLPDVKLSVEIVDHRFASVWRREKHIAVKPGPSVNNADLGDYSLSPGLEDRFFFLVAELRRSDGALISRSVYWPRCLKVMEDPEFRNRYRAHSQPSLVLTKGPWLRPQVSAMRTSLDVAVLERQDFGDRQSRLQVRVRNAGPNPAFFTQIDIQNSKRASYGTDNFFWLPPGEARVLDFRVLWRDVATRGQASVMVRAWNADMIQKPLFKKP